MTVLTTHLLDVSRLERGALQLAPRATDLVAMVRAVTDALVVDPRRHPIALEAPAELWAHADVMRLEQVVTNLLDNAVRYSPGGGAIRVTLERVRAEDGADCAKLTVRDHGVGVPEAQREQIFDRFHRAHAGAGDAGWAMGGLGLGLYIARQIVERHGGTIAHETPEGPGTRFVVTLPLAEAAVPAGSAA